VVGFSNGESNYGDDMVPPESQADVLSMTPECHISQGFVETFTFSNQAFTLRQSAKFFKTPAALFTRGPFGPIPQPAEM
jgi:hypothetical protein